MFSVIQLTYPLSLTLEHEPTHLPLVLPSPSCTWLEPTVLMLGTVLRRKLFAFYTASRWMANAGSCQGWFHQLLAGIHHHVLTAPIAAVLAGTAFAVPASSLVAISLLLGLHTGGCCHGRVMKHRGSQVGASRVGAEEDFRNKGSGFSRSNLWLSSPCFPGG